MNKPLSMVDHPAAWRGEELLQRPEWSLVFSNQEVDELLAAAEEVPLAPKDSWESKLLAATQATCSLPILEPKLQYVQQQLEFGSGVVRLTGFPAQSVPESLAKRAFWLLCRHIGTPVSQSAAGEKLFSVRDSGFSTEDRRARGPNTSKRLSFHTDRCDVISFLCFRQAKTGGDNDVVSSVALYNELARTHPHLCEVLMQPFLYQRHNVDVANELSYTEQPIFSFCEGHFAANLLRVLIERAYAMPGTPAMSADQREALDVLEQTAERSGMHVAFRQSVGDMLFLNNFVTLHRRSEFVDHAEHDLKRHLFRVWLSMPNSRPLDPRFAGNYGETAAGAIRGGMKPTGKNAD